MTNVVCIGECMIELSPRPDSAYALGFAGDVFNTAVYLKRSAPHFTVRFLSATGVDPFSRAMRAAWHAEGITEDLAFAVEDAIPGLYVITLDGKGERSFTYWRSASPACRWFDLLGQTGNADRLVGADLIYLSGISLAILPDEQRAAALDLLAELRRRGCRIAFDPNYRQALWPSLERAREVLGAALGVADIAFPSREDLLSVGLTTPAGGECVITCGAEGCVVIASGVETILPAPPLPAGQVCDTSGAGDSFAGAYLAARLDGHEPVSAARAALAVAARVVTASGAVVPQAVSHPIPMRES
jgi:2-dehydro-3-deoxygluconokinase